MKTTEAAIKPITPYTMNSIPKTCKCFSMIIPFPLCFIYVEHQLFGCVFITLTIRRSDSLIEVAWGII
jgi:hypothetical protein